jgi:hypothetical protein
MKNLVSSSKNKIGTILILGKKKDPRINYSQKKIWITVLVRILVKHKWN